MMLISYDISDDKLRTQFSKHLKKYGYRINTPSLQSETASAYSGLSKQK